MLGFQQKFTCLTLHSRNGNLLNMYRAAYIILGVNDHKNTLRKTHSCLLKREHKLMCYMLK